VGANGRLVILARHTQVSYYQHMALCLCQQREGGWDVGVGVNGRLVVLATSKTPKVSAYGTVSVSAEERGGMLGWVRIVG
jgi:hypothetical protein